MGWMTAFALGALLLAPAMAHAQRRGGGNAGNSMGGVNWTPGYGLSYGNPGYGSNQLGYNQGYGYNQLGYNQGYGFNPYYGSSGYTVPQWTGQTNPYAYGAYNMMPGYNYSQPGTTVMGQQQSGVTQAMYQSGNAPAYVRVIVPSRDAQVFFGETATQQTGTPVRDFYSPPLEPNKQFQYEIKAQWKQGDQTKEEKRTVDVQAGSRVMVNFAQPEGTQPLPNTQQLNQPGTQPSGTDNRAIDNRANRDNRGTNNRPPENR
jgi:uncharacterized protein (TIGR03000 family)